MTVPDQNNDATQEGAPASFASFLVQTNKGRTERELSEAMQKLVEAVRETGKPGRLQLVIEIKPQKNTEGVVSVSDTVTVKAPKLDRPASIFFIDADANLSRNDPNQRSIFDMDQENTTR